MEIKEFINIEGWLTIDEAMKLYELAKNNAFDGVIVEIGSWKGRSTVCLAKGSLAGLKNKVYAIDPHIAPAEKLKEYLGKNEVSTYEKFKSNIIEAQVAYIIEPIVDFSANALVQIKDNIDLIFIDGSHEYEDVLSDFNLFFPKIREGGVMAFHDTNGGGPKQVVKDNLYLSRNFKNVRFVDSITYGTKVNENSFTDRLRNRFTFAIFNIFNIYKRCITYIKMVMPPFVKAFGKTIKARL